MVAARASERLIIALIEMNEGVQTFERAICCVRRMLFARRYADAKRRWTRVDWIVNEAARGKRCFVDEDDEDCARVHASSASSLPEFMRLAGD